MHKRNQYFGFVIILLIVGVLQYFRKIISGNKMNNAHKVIYLCTMCIFVIGTMFILYHANVNNIVAFVIGLVITTSADSLAKLLILIDENFNKIAYSLIRKFLNFDLEREIVKDKTSLTSQENTTSENQTNETEKEDNQNQNS